VTFPFLTDAWIDAARSIRDGHAATATPIAAKIKMNQIITGAPFGDGDVHVYLTTVNGHIELEKGSLEDAEVTVTVDYDTAKKIFVDQDQAAGMQAFMAGKIKVQGDMTKLMAMQTIPVDETAKKVAEEIKAMTA
jgi:putative sterol carrier protein